jgi:tetratricopeptide (TPR) repeat protein
LDPLQFAYAASTLVGAAIIAVQVTGGIPSVFTLVAGGAMLVGGIVAFVVGLQALPGGAEGELLRAVALEERGDLDGAAAVYRAVADGKDPHRAADAAFLLARVHTQRRDLDAAALAYERVLELPRSRHTQSAAVGLASLALRQGRVDGARAAFERLAAADDPGLAGQGRAYLSMLAVAGGAAAPDDLTTVRDAAAAGDPVAGGFLHLVTQAADISGDTVGEPNGSEPSGDPAGDAAEPGAAPPVPS